MRVRHKALSRVLALPLTVLAGCVPVNPGPDYRRAAERSTTATGVERLFDPLQAEADAGLVRDWLADGLTADDAARIALLNNPSLQAAMYDIGAARADLVQAGLLSNPSLGVALRLPSAGGLANIDLDLAQNIADLWQIPPRQRAARHDLDQAILIAARRAADTAAQARAAYYAAIGADRRHDIARENLDIGRKIVELTEFRRDAGAGSELDVNLTRAVRLDAELALIQARLAAAAARRTLATVLGLADDADDLRLAEPLPDGREPAFDDDRLVALAWNERLDVRAVQHAVESASERLELERRRVFPSVSVGVALEREARPRSSGQHLLADTARASVAAGALTAPEIEPRSSRDKDTNMVTGPSLQMALPIWDQNQAQIAKAAFDLEQKERILAGMERTIRQEVREAADQARTAARLSRFYADEVVPLANKNLEMARDAYHAGRSTVLAVLEAERTYLTARQRQAEALQSAAAAVPEIERTIGLPMARLIQDAGVAVPTSQPAVTNPGPGDQR